MKEKKPASTSRYFLMSGLLHAFYWMDEGLQNHLRAAGMPGLSRTQSLIMTNVADGVTRPAELARRLGISRQAVQQLLADMQQRGLLDLADDPADARAKIIRYSSRGVQIGEITVRALEHLDDEIERRLGSKALGDLRRILLERDWGEPVTATPADVRLQKRRKGPSLEAVASRSPAGSAARPAASAAKQRGANRPAAASKRSSPARRTR
ncbi:MarR family winged helix-turn-helix transcriptional regulator [Solimonas terrae]|uniref:MarR family transcriptional regulator n=1 Tax=Solimonas terrae TaxID=1396819 RepID=A0A6M2BPX5_9GAMM|nr:MarR family transcriptional regulator [Solimonas terrae]NGY04265.1 MarR family transcriptional regulator [Solimonas terrae]